MGIGPLFCNKDPGVMKVGWRSSMVPRAIRGKGAGCEDKRGLVEELEKGGKKWTADKKG